MTVPYAPTDPHGVPTGRTILAPYVFCARPDLWTPLFGNTIDEMTSDPRTLNVLGDLIYLRAPRVIVEVGTYRGWGTMTFAETLRLYDLPGHVWSCDPVDHGVQQPIDQSGLTERITLVRGTFETLLEMLPGPMDFCYIDASDKDEASLRLRYTKLALAHLAPGGLIAVDDAAGDWRGAKTLRRLANLYFPEGRGLAFLHR